jgi:formylglycine-generating enzyme required for sulfatase activity
MRINTGPPGLFSCPVSASAAAAQSAAPPVPVARSSSAADSPGKAGSLSRAPAVSARGNDVPQANLNTNAPTDVGSYEPGPYGTYDQGGNVWEFNETRKGNKVGLRGGYFYLNDNAS